SLLIMISFFIKDTPTADIYPLSLHDALPISLGAAKGESRRMASAIACSSPGRACPQRRIKAAAVERLTPAQQCTSMGAARSQRPDRKSTRLNSSHVAISYAVFCLKKKKKT